MTDACIDCGSTHRLQTHHLVDDQGKIILTYQRCRNCTKLLRLCEALWDA